MDSVVTLTAKVPVVLACKSCPEFFVHQCTASCKSGGKPAWKPIPAIHHVHNASKAHFVARVTASFHLISKSGGSSPLWVTGNLHSVVDNPSLSYHIQTICYISGFGSLLLESWRPWMKHQGSVRGVDQLCLLYRLYIHLLPKHPLWSSNQILHMYKHSDHSHISKKICLFFYSMKMNNVIYIYRSKTHSFPPKHSKQGNCQKLHI